MAALCAVWGRVARPLSVRNTFVPATRDKTVDVPLLIAPHHSHHGGHARHALVPSQQDRTMEWSTGYSVYVPRPQQSTHSIHRPQPTIHTGTWKTCYKLHGPRHGGLRSAGNLW